jgi:hypothetical protein
MTEEQKLNNILINENAYFYQNIDAINITRSKIEQVFRDASSIKTGNYLLKIAKKEIQIHDNQVTYSLCIFRYETKPTFIDEKVDNWLEMKLAYLLIIEIEDYIIVSRKNISNIQNFIKQFYPLDYTILSTLFVSENTLLEKFSLKNLNISDKALREKSLEALDLRENFSSLGANNYMLSSLRVNNNNEKTSLMLGSSRINKFEKKTGIEQFCYWSCSLINKIKSHIQHETFLSIFAEPQDYESMRNSLIPISILLIFNNLYEDFENNRITTTFIRINRLNRERRFDLIKYLKNFERLLLIEKEENSFKVTNEIVNDLELKLNNKSITLQSPKLKNIMLRKDNGYDISLVDYINKSGSFLINFEDIDLVYSNRKLFKDSKLLGSIEQFMKIFIPYEDIVNLRSEKGDFQNHQTLFAKNSLFNFVERQFLDIYNYFICDDLGREWADHIGITEDRVTFYLSKYKDASFSATAFQDIIGQAQKNLGNFSPQDYQLNKKQKLWSNKYSNNHVTTNIKRLRKGNNINGAINQWKIAMNNPYFKRETYLVINFISKEELQHNLNQLKEGADFAKKNETIQILWFISSLVSSCKELNVDPYICCKP